MFKSTRRTFIQQSAAGLVVAGAGGLVLRSDASPTTSIISGAEANQVLIQLGPIARDIVATELKKVTPVSYGPWYRPGAPFRGKLNQPGEAGTTFILSGRAWAWDSKRPLPGVVLDFWHVDNTEKYSNGVEDFRNRGRLVTSETGHYELESIKPIPYRPNPGSSFWRCAHFHLAAFLPGYKPLVTEIHFQDDPKKNDPMYRPENAIAVKKQTANGVSFETGVFDIVLEKA